MSFIAEECTELWDYIHGDEFISPDEFNGCYNQGKYGLSISTNRFYFLEEMQKKYGKLKVACLDPSNDFWTKWEAFPGLLIYNGGINAAIDVHRSLFPNEIVIESDYPTYEENYDASKIIGAILEHKGFIPHYYYSGNKSIHIHVFLDWVTFFQIENKKEFIEWLRTKMISCWGIGAREFDTDLIKASHLIRAELSKNKKGFKTFLGYTRKDIGPVPILCNEENRIYPRLAEVRLSSPECTPDIIEEFKEFNESKARIKNIQRKNRPLRRFDSKSGRKDIRNCVKAILSDDFKKANDGFKRGMFILVNEVRNVFMDTQAKVIVDDWNLRMGNPVKQADIDYRFKTKAYTLTCDYIHKFLKELGIPLVEKCKRKLY